MATTGSTAVPSPQRHLQRSGAACGESDSHIANAIIGICSSPLGDYTHRGDTRFSHLPDGPIHHVIRCRPRTAVLSLRNEFRFRRNGRLLPGHPRRARRSRLRRASNSHLRSRTVSGTGNGLPSECHDQGLHMGWVGRVSEPNGYFPSTIQNDYPDSSSSATGAPAMNCVYADGLTASSLT